MRWRVGPVELSGIPKIELGRVTQWEGMRVESLQGFERVGCSCRFDDSIWGAEFQGSTMSA